MLHTTWCNARNVIQIGIIGIAFVAIIGAINSIVAQKTTPPSGVNYGVIVITDVRDAQSGASIFTGAALSHMPKGALA